LIAGFANRLHKSGESLPDKSGLDGKGSELSAAGPEVNVQENIGYRYRHRALKHGLRFAKLLQRMHLVLVPSLVPKNDIPDW
jgi:hypothetical protein